MARVGVAQASAPRVEDGVEAGHEHVEGDASQQCLINPLKYLTRRGGVQSLGGELEHAAGCRHHQRCWHSLARCVSHHDSQPTLRERVEVVEVASHFPSRSVVGRDLPALQLGHFLGERGMLDAPGYPKLLLDQLALVYLLHEILAYLLEVLHIYYVAGGTLGQLLAWRSHYLLVSLHGFFTLPQSNGDGLAALAIHKGITALIAVHLGQHLQGSNREAVEQLWLPVGGRGVGCVVGCYPGEHDSLSSFLLPREKTPGA